MTALPRPDHLRRFGLYGTTAESPEGEPLAVGVELPNGAVLATLDGMDVTMPPTTFTSMNELRRKARSLADGPGADVWVTYEDTHP